MKSWASIISTFWVSWSTTYLNAFACGYYRGTVSCVGNICRCIYHGAQYGHLCFSNFYIRLPPSVVQFSSIIGYADDHTLLKVIPLKEDRHRAADELSSDLAALFQLDEQWFIGFAPLKTKSLLVSLKQDTIGHLPCSLTIVQLLNYHHLRSWGSCLTPLLLGVLMWIWLFPKPSKGCVIYQFI